MLGQMEHDLGEHQTLLLDVRDRLGQLLREPHHISRPSHSRDSHAVR